jgi:pyruvate/2-oxoglutarate/acetoin dehydrogenase E1 component
VITGASSGGTPHASRQVPRSRASGFVTPIGRPAVARAGSNLTPLDVETVAGSVAKTSRAVCVEEGWPTYGVTAELAARIQKACFDDLDTPVERVGMAEVPLPYAKNLETVALPNEDRIARAVLATLDQA